MPFILRAIPCLSDNYAYLIHDPDTDDTAVIDVPDAAAVQAALDETGRRLSHILITHHHDDHIGGVDVLRAATGARVVGAAADAHRLPALDLAVAPGDRVQVGRESARVIDVSGHSVGHVAYHFPDSGLAFTGDSLMALGCGRLFEGTAAQMWDSLMRLDALDGETLIASGHDYMDANAAFALSIEPGNADLKARAERIAPDRAEGRPMAVVPLALERRTNPFLRAREPAVKAALGMTGAPDAEVFAEIRRRKDRF